MTLTDEELAARALEIDPDRSNIILAVGRKGSGKSAACRLIFDTWPYDRVVLDVTGDARPDDPKTKVLTAPFPSQLPEPDEPGERVTVWARVDPRSETYMEDQDAALSLALYPRHNPVLFWEDEHGQSGTANMIYPNHRLVLQSSRHYYVSCLFACPRPRQIPTLTIQQADKVLMFITPNREDREHVAKNIGYPVPLFEQAYAEMIRAGAHWFLLWDSHLSRLFLCPPLPVQARGPRA